MSELNVSSGTLVWEGATSLGFVTLGDNLSIKPNKMAKEMSVFEEMEYKEFMESKALKEISAKVKGAKEVAEQFMAVSRRISELARGVDADVSMINVYADDKQIKALNELVDVLTAKLEVFEDKKVTSSIDTLAEILGVKAKTKTLDKKDLAKSLGL